MSRSARPSVSTLIVLAKTPLAGRVKTRLCPPFSEAQAAALAEASLLDTLSAVAETPCARRVLVLDGNPGAWLPSGFEVIAQHGGDLAARLSDAFADVASPALLIGMDTPQVTPELLTSGLALLSDPASDAVLGLTQDGGYWTIGLKTAPRGVFSGVPMSRADTGAHQLARLHELGLRTEILPELRDVDDHDDALAVAAGAPGTHFARRVSELTGAAIGAPA